MPNKARGDATLNIDGKNYALRMTLGAMAEIEDSFDLKSIDDIDTIFPTDEHGELQIRAGAIIKLLGALMRGGGNDISDEEVGKMNINGLEAATAALEAISLQAPKTENSDSSKKQKPAAKKSGSGRK